MESYLVIGLLAILLYIGTAGGFAFGINRQRQALPWPRRGVIALGLGAALLHAGALLPALIQARGLDLGLANAFSLIALLTVLIALFSMCWRPLESLGVALLPLAALSIATQFALPDTGADSAVHGWGLDLHVVLSVLAYSLLVVAALQAGLFAFQESRLRHRHPGGLIRALPPLREMEALLWQMLQLGFMLLTLSLLSGLLFLEDIFAQHLVHKTVLSIAAWFAYGTLLFGRWRWGWRGQIAVRWALGGFVFLMLGYFGSKFVLELLLAR